MSELEPRHTDRLSEPDAAALDRVMDAGPDAGATDERTRRVSDLLALLGTPVAGESDRDARVCVTSVRVGRDRHDDLPARLTDQDADALDHWMRHDRASAGPLQARVDRHEALARLGTSGASSSISKRDDLIARTMAAVQSEQKLRSARMRFEQGPELTGWRMRLADLVSIAAMLLIGASIALPAFSAVGRHQEQVACLNNMQATSRAFGTYANDNADMLPMATAGFGGSWLDVGTPRRSNSANLFTLPREGYTTLDDLACPGNPQAPTGKAHPDDWDWRSIDQLSYSYRIMTQGGMRVSIAVPSTTAVILTADRSPITLRAVRRLPVIPEANSPNHDARGQHLLSLDGSATWTRSPVVGGDNVWLPRPIEQVIQSVRAELGLVKGTEIPASETDAFVGP